MSLGPTRWIAPAVLLGGVAFLAWSVSHGGASLYLVLVFPVLTGSSVSFLIGTILLILGVLLLPLAFERTELEIRSPFETAPAGATASAPDGHSSGGLVLIGPFPLFFGAWRNPPRVVYWLAALVGAGLVAFVLVLLFVGV
jgi:uncharacterized membrane protein